MLKDIFDALSKVGTRPLLVVFAALAISTFSPSGGPFKDPISATSLLLPIFVMISYALVISWILLVHDLNSRLPEYDLASWGPILGGSGLTFCLCVTFQYVSSEPDPISLRLFGRVEFIRLLALYFFRLRLSI